MRRTRLAFPNVSLTQLASLGLLGVILVGAAWAQDSRPVTFMDVQNMR